MVSIYLSTRSLGVNQKDEVNEILYHYFHNGVTPKSLMSFFVALISKVKSPLESGDFKPISFLSYLCKLMAKAFEARLARVMEVFIPPEQSTFIKGRQLVDGVVFYK